MIEKIVLDYLKTKLNTNIYMEHPTGNNVPSKFVLIDKTGSGEEEHLHNATLAIQSYDTSMFKAAQLNEQVKTAMKEIESLDSITKCELNSDYNYTDVETKRYRYQAVFDIYYY